jgi:hypothetical protein
VYTIDPVYPQSFLLSNLGIFFISLEYTAHSRFYCGWFTRCAGVDHPSAKSDVGWDCVYSPPPGSLHRPTVALLLQVTPRSTACFSCWSIDQIEDRRHSSLGKFPKEPLGSHGRIARIGSANLTCFSQQRASRNFNRYSRYRLMTGNL